MQLDKLGSLLAAPRGEPCRGKWGLSLWEGRFYRDAWAVVTLGRFWGREGFLWTGRCHNIGDILWLASWRSLIQKGQVSWQPRLWLEQKQWAAFGTLWLGQCLYFIGCGHGGVSFLSWCTLVTKWSCLMLMRCDIYFQQENTRPCGESQACFGQLFSVSHCTVKIRDWCGKIIFCSVLYLFLF